MMPTPTPRRPSLLTRPATTTATLFVSCLLLIAAATAHAVWSRVGSQGNDTSVALSTDSRIDTFCQLFPTEAKLTKNDPAVDGHHSLAPLEQLASDCRDGRLDQFSFLEAGWIASGVTERAAKRRYQRRVDTIVSDLTSDLAQFDDTPQFDSDLAKAQQVHEYLHERLLTGRYQVTASELQGVFESGDFNCVSATLLYCHLCRELGLESEIVQWPDHVACRVIAITPQGQQQVIAVEATCRQWFQDNVVASRAPHAFAVDRGPGQVLTATAALSLIDYNRGVIHLHEKRYQAALQASYRALRLAPANTAAWNNLLAAINNRALACCDRGDNRLALELLQRGQRLAPRYEAFAVNIRHVERRLAPTAAPQGS